MKFTDRGIAGLKPKRVRYEKWEDGRTGFGIRIAPSGRKSWLYMYRFSGTARRMTLGVYPKKTLADARVAFAAAKKNLASGIDPGRKAVEAREAERKAETVGELIDEYIEKWAKPRKRSAAEDERCLEKDVAPDWQHRKAKSITKRDVILLLDKIVDRGAPIMANRTLAVISKMFSFAVDRAILGDNPCRSVRAPGKEVRRDRILSEVEIKKFWAGLDDAGMSDQVRLALRFLLITGQRRSEVVEADWAEFDLANKTWTIAAERSKNGIAHVVPLSLLALELLTKIGDMGKGSRWLFPSPRSEDRPIGRTAVNHALAVNRDVIGVPNFGPHDLRRSAISHMTALGISRLVVGKILNHVDRTVTGIYDRHDYYDEKAHALNVWGQRLEEILSGQPAPDTAKVVNLRSPA